MSKVEEFIPAQAAPIIAILILMGVIVRNPFAGLSLRSTVFSLLVFCALAITSVGIGRSVLALAFLIFSFVAFLASRQLDKNLKPLAFFILGLSVIWLLPELVVSDWAIDNRTDWVRFNTVMRFWLDGYYLIPMVTLALLGSSIIEHHIRYRIAACLLGTIISVQTLSLYPLLKNRFERTPEAPSTDGFAFLAQEYQTDWWIIDYLSRLKEPVVIAETCGSGSSPSAPYHYGMPGRVAAFSGRPSLCGWGRHTWMFQPVFKSGVLAGQNVWSSFLEYQEALTSLFRASSSETQIQKARTLLRSRGVTHLIYGELEERVFGSLDLSEVSKRVTGEVVLKATRGRGVIKLIS